MRRINIGGQGFDNIRENGYFFVDKTPFIKEWWESGKDVTLITRPRRFGKTLNLSMLECFFSNRYAGRGAELFDGLKIWNDEEYRKIQGTYPVIFLSLADVKENNFTNARMDIIGVLQDLYEGFRLEWQDDSDSEKKKYSFMDIDLDSPDPVITRSLKRLTSYLNYRYGKKVLIFLDEYDTPMQEAYLNGYWDEMSSFMRSLFNSTFKTNPSMERAVMTGITRVSKESIFSDLNNPDVVTTVSDKYATSFGFTEKEVIAALDEYDLSDEAENVKKWYDGFTFGNRTDIYNPWSIINFLDKRKFDTYWVNTSSNSLISSLIRKGHNQLKTTLESLLVGGNFKTALDDEIVFSDLESGGPEKVWSLMLASGYLRIVSTESGEGEYDPRIYTLTLTNGEVRRMFVKIIRQWFEPAGESNDLFINAMIHGDTESMNVYMNQIALSTISYFDTGRKPADEVESTPERFYHGFVLGLLVRENAKYSIRSNRESGHGRYDICMFPKDDKLPGIVIEFKVLNSANNEKALSDTADNALKQIVSRDYEEELKNSGIHDIFMYGFAFSGKKVLIKKR